MRRSVRVGGALGCLLAFAAVVPTGTAVSDVSAPTPFAFVQVASETTASAGGDIDNTILGGRYMRGMRVVRAELGDVAGSLRAVTDGFACASDPAFSADGTRLAFAGKRRPADPLQIWELVHDDPEPLEVVPSDTDCITPAYLPDGGILFASLAAREYEEHGGWYSFSLYALAPGADTPTRLTFNPSSDFDPAVQPDGRVVYSAWQHVGNHHWPRGTVALMLINADGTGVFPLTGNHREPWLKSGATPFGTDRIAFTQADRPSGFGGGALVATDLNDAFAPYTALVPADQYTVAGVAPLPDGGLLVSARPRDGSRPTFGLYTWRDGALTLLFDDPAQHELAPTVGGPRRRPELRFSTVVPETPYGYVLVLNCTATDRTDQGHLRQGSVKRVRILEGRPLRHTGSGGAGFFARPGAADEPLIGPNAATGYIPSRILGEVTPAEDGSVYVKVPADRPLRMQLIGRDGLAVMNERAWFWVRPNERRACLGCHADRELSPTNAAPLAARQPPHDLTDSAGWETVSFLGDVQPLLQQNCALSGCHVPPKPTAGMNLHAAARLTPPAGDAVLTDRFGPAYANLLARQAGKPFAVGGRRVHPGNARQSPLLWMLAGRPLGPQYAPAPFERPMLMPHPGPPMAVDQLWELRDTPAWDTVAGLAARTPLSDAQRRLIGKWIDLGAQYAADVPADPWPNEHPDSAVSPEVSDAE